MPSDHGSWVFLLSPLLIGLAAGGRWTTPVAYLIVASVCGFLSRQPITIAVKSLCGRRSRDDLAPALLWTLIYGLIGSVHVLGLWLRGFGYILYLGIPGLIVFGWYLYLVARRDERNQAPMEIVGAGVLALTAPAALWAGVGEPVGVGWLLWILTWTQATASIVVVYLKLKQRRMSEPPPKLGSLTMALPSLTLTSLNLLGVVSLGLDRHVSTYLAVAYLPQWLEAVRSTWKPAMGIRPTTIGLRQLAVSTLYTLLFIWTW